MITIQPPLPLFHVVGIYWQDCKGNSEFHADAMESGYLHDSHSPGQHENDGKQDPDNTDLKID